MKGKDLMLRAMPHHKDQVLCDSTGTRPSEESGSQTGSGRRWLGAGEDGEFVFNKDRVPALQVEQHSGDGWGNGCPTMWMY